MPSNVFEQLLIEQIKIFENSFSSVSDTVFYDREGKLIHPGEYGTYREAICRDFLRFFIPRRLDLAQGFLINDNDEISHQCDIVVFDSNATPLIQTENRQRFFPVETVCAVGEVKSTLSRSKLRDALRRLAKLKAMRERIKSPVVLKKDRGTPYVYDPENDPYDQLFTFLICKKFDFDLRLKEHMDYLVDEVYEDETPYRHRHNLILSLDDGIVLYYDSTQHSLAYPVIGGNEFKHVFARTETNPFAHYKFFASYVFMGTSSATILYPEITNYMGSIEGGANYRQE